MAFVNYIFNNIGLTSIIDMTYEDFENISYKIPEIPLELL